MLTCKTCSSITKFRVKKTVNTSAVVIKNIASSVQNYLALHNRLAK